MTKLDYTFLTHILSPDCTCQTGFHDLHSYRSGECIKAVFHELCMMTPRDSTGTVSDNEIQRTGELYPAMVSNSLWALSTDRSTSNCKLTNLDCLFPTQNFHFFISDPQRTF